MWCSRRNGRIMFSIGAMLLLVGLGVIVMGYNIPGAITMCVGLFPLVIGYFIVVSNVKIEKKMLEKKNEKN